jgi:hypothetical protein
MMIAQLLGESKMAERLKWYSEKGLVATCAMWTRTYERVLPKGSHMRIGHFATVVGVDGTLVAARAYPDHILDDPRCNIKRTSKHWESSKRDRLSQIEKVRAVLKPSHPLFAELIADMNREVESFK